MQIIIVLIILVILIGAIAGGNSFGETIRTGCGWLVFLVILLIIFSG